MVWWVSDNTAIQVCGTLVMRGESWDAESGLLLRLPSSASLPNFTPQRIPRHPTICLSLTKLPALRFLFHSFLFLSQTYLPENNIFHRSEIMASRPPVGGRPGARFAQFKLVLLGKYQISPRPARR